MNAEHIFQQMMNKQLGNRQEFLDKKNYIRSISAFYFSYNIACAVLGFKEDKKYTNKRQSIWRNIMTKKINGKLLKEMNKIMDKDFKIIVKANEFIDKQIEKQGGYKGNLYIEGMLFIATNEFPN